MNDDAFLQAILANPDNEVRWLIYADWLAEQGDSRADVVRAHPEVRRVVAQLMTAKATPFDLIERRASAGHNGFLRTLVCAGGIPRPAEESPVAGHR